MYGAQNKKYHEECASGDGLNALFQWVTWFLSVVGIKNKMWHRATSVRQKCDMWRAWFNEGVTFYIFIAKSGSEAFKMAFLGHFLYMFIMLLVPFSWWCTIWSEMLIKVLKTVLDLNLDLSWTWIVKNKLCLMDLSWTWILWFLPPPSLNLYVVKI